MSRVLRAATGATVTGRRERWEAAQVLIQMGSMYPLARPAIAAAIRLAWLEWLDMATPSQDADDLPDPVAQVLHRLGLGPPS